MKRYLVMAAQTNYTFESMLREPELMKVLLNSVFTGNVTRSRKGNLKVTNFRTVSSLDLTRPNAAGPFGSQPNKKSRFIFDSTGICLSPIHKHSLIEIPQKFQDEVLGLIKKHVR